MLASVAADPLACVLLQPLCMLRSCVKSCWADSRPCALFFVGCLLQMLATLAAGPPRVCIMCCQLLRMLQLIFESSWLHLHFVSWCLLQMLATLAADPLASLVDTAFVGHLGAAQLAGTASLTTVSDSIAQKYPLGFYHTPLLMTLEQHQMAGATLAASLGVKSCHCRVMCYIMSQVGTKSW
eukprot:GHRQ01022894.1.p1 GENE.GHRQ01022894.1~~GHRQ01022894.1.p1  ORF type:complete len:182 (-),score=7.57 GHRQ01022894.1:240-785(-)